MNLRHHYTLNLRRVIFLSLAFGLFLTPDAHAGWCRDLLGRLAGLPRQNTIVVSVEAQRLAAEVGWKPEDMQSAYTALAENYTASGTEALSVHEKVREAILIIDVLRENEARRRAHINAWRNTPAPTMGYENFVKPMLLSRGIGPERLLAFESWYLENHYSGGVFFPQEMAQALGLRKWWTAINLDGFFGNEIANADRESRLYAYYRIGESGNVVWNAAMEGQPYIHRLTEQDALARTGHTFDKLFATGLYAPGQALHHLAIFRSYEDFIRRVKNLRDSWAPHKRPLSFIKMATIHRALSGVGNALSSLYRELRIRRWLPSSSPEILEHRVFRAENQRLTRDLRANADQVFAILDDLSLNVANRDSLRASMGFLRIAIESDLRSAEELLTLGGYGTSVYHAQQAAEKVLKALKMFEDHKTISKSESFKQLMKIGHSLSKILEKIKNEISNPTRDSWDSLTSAATLLDPLATEYRYPNDLNRDATVVPTERITQEALLNAKRIVSLVLSYLREVNAP